MARLLTRSLLMFTLLIIASYTHVYGQRYGGRYAPRARSFSITGMGGVAVMGCDLTNLDDNYYFEPAGGIEFGYLTSQSFKIGAYVLRGNMTAKQAGDEAKNTFNAIGITGHVYLRIRNSRVSPYAFFKVGGIFSTAEAIYNFERKRETANGLEFGGGVGVEIYPSSLVGIQLQIGGILTTSDHLDALETGTMNDGYSTTTFGISYYFSRRR
jgi:Outer membrane protein beta-barrel domain